MLLVRNFGDRDMVGAGRCRCGCFCFCTCFIYFMLNANYQSNGCAYASTNGENIASMIDRHEV
jgi:hypothetical protein